MARARTEVDAAARLFELIGGKWSTQAIGATVELGIADALSQGPREAATLAREAGCDVDSLRRLLRALACLGVCREREDARYELTAMGALLRTGGAASLRSWALWTSRYQWETWGRLAESVRAGTSARRLAGGDGGYGHLEVNPEAAAVFNQAMVEISGLVGASVLAAYDFSKAHLIVDIGGGYGELACAVAAANRHLRAIVFDLAHAADGARQRIAAMGVTSRCRFVAGSFFESVPRGGDVHLLKSILHNWPDERCARILRACRVSLPARGRLLVIERVMPERITGEDGEQVVLRGDLNMMVGLGGRERTLAELEALLAAEGFGIDACIPLALGYRLIEASG